MAAQGPSGDQGKRNGNVQLELAQIIHEQSEEQLSRLDKLVASLNETQTAFKHDRRGLAQLFAGLQQFMEDALGINSMYKSQPKLPASLFHDTSPSGPLHTIASVCADAMRVRGMKRIDWASPALRKENLELVSRLRQELLRAGHLRPPRVYVHPSCASETLRLTHAVTRLGGEVAPVETTPGVTHVVYPFGPKGDPDDGQTYLRALEKRGALVRVHWWYLPDSYDEWLPAAAAPEEVEPDRRPRGPWRVYSRWLADSEKHNEWMNPADYETEEAAAGGEEGGGAKRRALPRSSRMNSRHAPQRSFLPRPSCHPAAAVERHGEDWAAIAEAVGTKNAMQCCTRFLQMPIEEAIVAEAVASDGRQGWVRGGWGGQGSGARAGGCEMGMTRASSGGVTIPEPGEEDGADPGAGALLPFADAGNPVMAQVAFLATMVGPRVAAAAAQRALEVLGEEDAALGEAEREEDGVGEWPKREDEGNECAEEPTAGKGPMKAEEGSETRDGMGLGVGESSPAPSVAGDAPISAPRLRAAAATALAAAAAKAKLLADAEERELQRLVLAAVDTQYKKIKIKLQAREGLSEA
ncbi:hypothetical protein APUTEX25_003456 [Auxenochlorella protothecoides]|uniref:SWI/SNF complex subunit SMARCC2 n=1 Tax=Auxenochlorella protothecoides TaxID=3075 RepID=A0A3M7KXT7_AUXPR|nr:hypothetical protein APUTEX25_003456 [Auxenochlorella protothecoides]|eukprot:RMZ55318.1 hypothetical protein APUTEX25_003456 [Auxenochlorella protothecoides]